MQTMCPTVYGTAANHTAPRLHYTLVLVQTQKNPHAGQRWRAGVTCEARLVVEGPEAPNADQAVEMLSESVAAKLARCIGRAWEGEEGAGYEEDREGCRFASERANASRGRR